MKSVQIQSYFWSVFSCIQSEYRKIRTRNNSVFGHFSHSIKIRICTPLLKKSFKKVLQFSPKTCEKLAGPSPIGVSPATEMEYCANTLNGINIWNFQFYFWRYCAYFTNFNFLIMYNISCFVAFPLKIRNMSPINTNISWLFVRRHGHIFGSLYRHYK